MKTESRREEQRAKEDVRGEAERGRNHQVTFGITRVSNMEDDYWQVSLTYIVWKLEKLQAEMSLSTFE